jgi:hypothetical protein
MFWIMYSRVFDFFDVKLGKVKDKMEDKERGETN